MTITAEELRKVYEEAFYEIDASAYSTKDFMFADRHPKALLAVARYVAEKQRGMEPTPEMLQCFWHEWVTRQSQRCYRVMQSVAPLVVE